MNQKLFNYLEGFLEAIAILNLGINRVASYEVSGVEIDAKKSLDGNVAGLFPTNYRIKKETIADWKTQLIAASKDYFFRFLEDNTQSSSQLPVVEFKENLINRFIELLELNLDDLEQVYQLEIDSKEQFYEAQYQDFVFVTKTDVILVHFGISD